MTLAALDENNSVSNATLLLSNLQIESTDSPAVVSSESNPENKENEKPWYEGIVHKPVAFRAAKRTKTL